MHHASPESLHHLIRPHQLAAAWRVAFAPDGGKLASAGRYQSVIQETITTRNGVGIELPQRHGIRHSAGMRLGDFERGLTFRRDNSDFQRPAAQRPRAARAVRVLLFFFSKEEVMASSLVALKFDTPDGAEKGLEVAASLQKQHLLELLDAAI